MGYLIKSDVIDTLREDMETTMMCYKGQAEQDIIRFCYENMERAVDGPASVQSRQCDGGPG